MSHAYRLLAAGRRPLGLVGCVLVAGALAGFLGGDAGLDEPRSAPAALASAPDPDPAPAPAWFEDAQGARLFAMQPNAFGAAPAFHHARRQATGPGRIEQLAFGSPDPGSPHLRLSLFRAGEEAGASVSFWLEMARRAGEAGLSLERAAAVPDVAPTRLGAFHVGALRVRGAEGARTCLGFRHEASAPLLVISGLGCMDAGERETRDALVCALEGLTIADRSADPAAAAFFARARSRAPECRARVANVAPERRR